MIIEAENICKSYGELQVLKNVDFAVERGEVVSVVGASGAGKTTFLQIIGTLLTPDSGVLRIAGTQVGEDERRLAEFRNKHLGFVFQSHHLLPEFTAVENVYIPALIAGEGEKSARKRALDVLLADEPTGNLDSKTKEEIHSLLFSLRDELAQTIVLVTHDSHLAGLCDRCLEMKDGRFI